MINFIILIAKYCLFASNYKMLRLTSEGFFLNCYMKERKEAEHFIGLA